LLYDFGLAAEVHAEELAQLTPYVLLPQAHPLASQSAIALEQLAREPLVLLDVEPSRDYFLSLFRDRGLTALVGYRTASLEMVRGLVGHGLGYSLLATKPANSMSYDGRALLARPLSHPVRSSRLVLAHLAQRPLSAPAQVFAGLCRTFFQSGNFH
jgi:DNA-binding transcriptional LysR family regulator